MGWLGGWKYAVEVTVSNSSSNDLSDVQVLIELGSDFPGWNDVKSDGSDIRITASDGTTVLPLWIKKFDATNKVAVIWTKVSSIPANGQITLYLYYGNPSATSVSNGSEVFEFFDGFETWSGWTTYGSGVISQSSEKAYTGTYSLKKDTNGDPNGGYKELGFTLNYPFILEAEVIHTYFSGANWDRIGVIDDSGNGYGAAAAMQTSSGSPLLVIDKRASYSTTDNFDQVTLSKSASSDWYTLRFVWNNGSLKAEAYYNGELLGTSTYTDTTYNSFTRVYVFGGYTYYVDNLRIRKLESEYVSTSVSSAVITVPWLSGWTYRRELTLSSASVASEVYIIELNESNFDFSLVSSKSEFRVTASDGTTVVPYFVEYFDPLNKYARIVFRCGNNCGDTTYYLYYGNTSADDASSTSVYDTFLSFEQAIPSGWTCTGVWDTANSSTCPLYSSTVALDGSYSVAIHDGSTSSGCNGRLYTTPPSSTTSNGTEYNFKAVVYFYLDLANNYQENDVCVILNNDTFLKAGYVNHTASNNPAVAVETGTTTTTLKSTSLSSGLTLKQWYRLEVDVSDGPDGGSITVSLYDNKGTQVGTVTYSSTSTIGVKHVGLFLGTGAGQTGYIYVDEYIIYNRFTTTGFSSVTVGAQYTNPAWKNGYKYRRKVTISNGTSTDGQNVVVPVILTTSNFDSFSKVNSDGSDIVFADFNDNILPYFVDIWDSSNSIGVCYVKLSDLPANGSVDIYMYYGNSDVTTSKGTSNIFVFYDDFETWSGWSNAGSGSVSQSSTYHYKGSYSLNKTTNCDPNGGKKALPVTISRGTLTIYMDAYAYRASGSGTDCYADRFGIENNGNGYSFAIGHGSAPTLWIDKRSAGSGTVESKVSLSSDILSKWYWARLVITSDTVYAILMDTDGTVVKSTSFADTSAASSFNQVAIRGGRPYYVDDIKVYVGLYPQPSITIGTEEDIGSTSYTQSLSDKVTISSGKVVSPTVVIKDSGSFTDGKITFTVKSNHIDKVQFLDSKVSKVGSILLETVTEKDTTPKFGIGYNIPEQGKLTDSKIFGVSYHLEENVKESDLVSKGTILSPFTEKSSVSDSGTRQGRPMLVDNVSLSDSYVRQIFFNLLEKSNLTDMLAKFVYDILSESISLKDSFSTSAMQKYFKTLTDKLDVTELNITYLIGLVLGTKLSLSDIYGPSSSHKVLIENPKIIDELVRDISFFIGLDKSTLSELVEKSVTPTYKENLSISDINIKNGKFVYKDSVNLDDKIGFMYGRLVSEVIKVTDRVVKGINWRQFESIVSRDIPVDDVETFLKESLQSLDKLQKQFERGIVDKTTLKDTLDKELVILMVFDDLLKVSDSLDNVSLGLLLNDFVSVKDIAVASLASRLFMYAIQSLITREVWFKSPVMYEVKLVSKLKGGNPRID